MTGAWTDPARGLVSVIVLEMGGSSDLCAVLKPGEPVVLMGPTGTPTEILDRYHHRAGRRRLGQRRAVLHRRRTARGGLPRALFRRLQADARPLQGAGDRARRRRHRLVLRRGARLRPPDRPQDRAFVGNIVQAMAAYGAGRLGEPDVPLSDVDHMIVIGSDRMMQAVGAARHGVLAPC